MKCPFKGPVGSMKMPYGRGGVPLSMLNSWERQRTWNIIADDGVFISDGHTKRDANWLRDAINAAIEREKEDNHE